MSLLTRSRLRTTFNVHRPVFAFIDGAGRIAYTRDTAAYLALAAGVRRGVAYYVPKGGDSVAINTVGSSGWPADLWVDPAIALAFEPGFMQPTIAYGRGKRIGALDTPLEVQFTAGGHSHRVVFNMAAGGQLEQWHLDGDQLINRENGHGRCIQTDGIFFETAVAPDTIPYLHNPTQAGDRKGVLDLGTAWERFTGAPMWRVLGPSTNPDGSISIELLSCPSEFGDGTSTGVPGYDTDHGCSDALNDTAIYDTMVMGLRYDFMFGGNPHAHRVTSHFYTPIDLSAVGQVTFSELGIQSPIVVLVQANNGSTAVIDQLYACDAAGAGTLIAFNGHAQFGGYDGEPVTGPSLGQFNQTNTYGVDGPLGFSPVPSGAGGMIARRSVTDRGIGLYGRVEAIGGQMTSWSWNRRRLAGTEGLDGSNYCLFSTDWTTNLTLRTPSTPQALPAGWTSRSTFLVTGTLNEMRDAMVWLRVNGLG